MAGKFLCVNMHMIWSAKVRRRLVHPQWNDYVTSHPGLTAGPAFFQPFGPDRAESGVAF